MKGIEEKTERYKKKRFPSIITKYAKAQGQTILDTRSYSSTICSLTSEGSKSYKMPKGREAPPKPEELIEKLSDRLEVVKTESK